MTDTGELVCDEVTLVCNGCQSERHYKLEPHLRGAAEVIAWLKTQPTHCPNCDATTCDAKFRMVAPS